MVKQATPRIVKNRNSFLRTMTAAAADVKSGGRTVEQAAEYYGGELRDGRTSENRSNAEVFGYNLAKLKGMSNTDYNNVQFPTLDKVKQHALSIFASIPMPSAASTGGKDYAAENQRLEQETAELLALLED